MRDCCELAHRVVGCCPYEVGAGGHGRLPVCGWRGSAVPVRALKQARSGADAYCSVLRLLLSTASLAGWASEARWGRPRTRLVDTTAKRTRHAVCVCVCVCDVINKLLNKKGSSLLKSETKYLFQGNFFAEEAQVESSVGSVV